MRVGARRSETAATDGIFAASTHRHCTQRNIKKREPSECGSVFVKKRPGLRWEGPALVHVRRLTRSRCGSGRSASGAGAAGRLGGTAGLGTAACRGGTAGLRAAAAAAAGAGLGAAAEQAPPGAALTRLRIAGRGGGTGRLGSCTGRLRGGGATGFRCTTGGLGTGVAAVAGGGDRLNGRETDEGQREEHRHELGETLHENLLMTIRAGSQSLPGDPAGRPPRAPAVVQPPAI